MECDIVNGISNFPNIGKMCFFGLKRFHIIGPHKEGWSDDKMPILIWSSAGSVIGGALTFLGVLLTIHYHKKSDQKKMNLQIFSERPDLKIVDITNDKHPDLEMILVPIKGVKSYSHQKVSLLYAKVYTKPKNELEYFDYHFKNAGKTAISRINFLSGNKKEYSLFGFYKADLKREISDGSPKFNAYLDKRVDPEDIVKIRMYHGENLSGFTFSAPITIVLFDTIDRIYSQSFFYPKEKINSSRHYWGGYKKYLNDISMDCYLDDMILELKQRSKKM